MIVFLNGVFVPEENAVVSVFDRSFRYGDGLFETVLLRNGKPFRWAQHFERLQRSAEFLRIPLACSPDDLLATIDQVASKNCITDGLIRVTVSRGTGPPGYAPAPDARPTLIVSSHPLSTGTTDGWRLTVASIRLAVGDRLQQHKTASRLANVLASMEARDSGADEALLLDTNDCIADGATSNLFWIRNHTVHTVPISNGALPGVTRAAVLEICCALEIRVQEQTAKIPDLLAADGVFVTLTSRGVVGVSEIDGHPLSRAPLLSSIAKAYRDMVARECA